MLARRSIAENQTEYIPISYNNLENANSIFTVLQRFLAKEIKNGANKLSEQVTRVTAPKLAEKLEAAINTKIGSVVRIPLKL